MNGWSCQLKPISEADVKVERVHSKGYGLELAFKDAVKAPCEVGIDGETLIGTPCAAYLQTVVETAKVIAEVVG